MSRTGAMQADPPTHFNFARDVVERWARERPDALALWCVGEHDSVERKLTFRQLAEQSRRAASFFDQLGIHRGDRVLVITPRVPQWWITMLGLIGLGAVPIPGTPLLTAKDIRYRVETAEIAAIIADDDGAAKAEGVELKTRLLVGGGRTGWISFDAGLREGDPHFDPEPTRSDDPGLIYFTSGTTGPPKMVLHTQASYGLGHRITGQLWLDLKPDDVHWCITDTGWAKAAWSCVFG
ncbi:MAG TPA: AMP-binding protein, partial [Verrucomicrobiae bacterium]|nr:AMP-binding protein [Verrucomicrobiae bacterium]